MNKNSKKETRSERFQLYVEFLDGRTLYLCDYYDEIIGYLAQWTDEIRTVKINKIYL